MRIYVFFCFFICIFFDTSVQSHEDDENHISIDAYIPTERDKSVEPNGKIEPIPVPLYEYSKEPGIEAICDEDDRIRVPNTGALPHTSVAKLILTARSGNQYIGTGFFTANNELYTAGHVVYVHDDGGYVSNILVQPAREGGVLPFGTFTAFAWGTTENWINDKARTRDMAVIRLRRADNHNDCCITPDTTYSGYAGIAGYPADLLSGLVMHSSESAVSRTVNSLGTLYSYHMDTFGGQSGSPILRGGANGTAAIGIHAAGGCPNVGPGITSRWLRAVEVFNEFVNTHPSY